MSLLCVILSAAVLPIMLSTKPLPEMDVEIQEAEKVSLRSNPVAAAAAAAGRENPLEVLGSPQQLDFLQKKVSTYACPRQQS